MKFAYLFAMFACVVIIITCSTDDGIELTDGKPTAKETATPAASPKSQDYVSKRIVGVEYYDNRTRKEDVALYARFLADEVAKCNITKADICILGTNKDGDKYQNRIATLTKTSTETGGELRGTVRNRHYYLKFKACDDDSWSDSEARKYDLSDVQVEEFNTTTKGTSFQIDKANTSWECDLPSKFGKPITNPVVVPKTGSKKFDRLTAYDVTIDGLKDKKIKDIHVTSSHVYILTDSRIFKYTSKGADDRAQVDDVAVETGQGVPYRMTGDRDNLYVGYTQSNNDSAIRKIPYEGTPPEMGTAVPFTTTALTVAEIKTDGVWTVATYPMNDRRARKIFSMATNEGMPHIFINFLTNASGSKVYYGTSFFRTGSASDVGKHNSAIPPVLEAPVGGVGIAHTLGSAVTGGQYCTLWFIPGKSKAVSCRDITSGYNISASGSWAHGKNLTDLDQNSRGFAGLNGVGWFAKSTSTGTKLYAIQLSEITPANPFVP